jgi:hypothetical protein
VPMSQAPSTSRSSSRRFVMCNVLRTHWTKYTTSSSILKHII